MKSDLNIKGKLTATLIPGPNHRYTATEKIIIKLITLLKAISLKIRGN